MDDLFQGFFRAGLFGSIIILLILILRPLLKRGPRQLICILWLLAAVRLLLPFTIESPLSLQPELPYFEDTSVRQPVTTPEQTPDDRPAEPPVSQPQQNVPPVTVPPITVPEPQKTVTLGQMLPTIWLCGVGAMMLYGIVSYLLLKRRLQEAVKEDGCLVTDRVKGAFVMGCLRPRIYLPAYTDAQDRPYIVAHERAHIARGDHWWKLLGFLCLCLHWYNPLAWVSFVLFGRDTEVACDERVVWGMTLEERKAYSVALLNSGRQMSGLAALTLCFGKESLKQRIRNVLSFRKPGIWITMLAGMLVVATALFFLTSPETRKDVPTDPMDGTTPTTQGPTTVSPTTGAPTTAPADPTTVPTTVPPTTAPVETVPPTTEPPETVPPTTAPPVTEPPVTEPPATEPPVTEPPVTEPVQPTASGFCGENLRWVLQGSVLTISGTGEMYDYDKNTPEWMDYRLEVTTIIIEEGTTGFMHNAFNHFENLTSVSLPSTLQSISGRMFLSCDKLTSIRIPENVTEIGDYAFTDCFSLKEIVIPASVTIVRDGAFWNCTALEKVTIQGAPWLINTFRDCTALKEVWFYGDPPRLSIAFEGVTATAYYPANNPAWTEEKIQSYDAELAWVAIP